MGPYLQCTVPGVSTTELQKDTMAGGPGNKQADVGQESSAHVAVASLQRRAAA